MTGIYKTEDMYYMVRKKYVIRLKMKCYITIVPILHLWITKGSKKIIINIDRYRARLCINARSYRIPTVFHISFAGRSNQNI